MAIDNWKAKHNFHEGEHFNLEFNDMEDDEEMGSLEHTETPTMKNIFVNSKIKRQKFSKEIVDTIKFGSIKNFMDIQDAQEAYLGAYSEEEFFAYRFQKTHGFYPDMFKMYHINYSKFLTQLFKFANIPPDCYYKSFEDTRGDITINLIVFCIETGRDDKLYLYLDSDEASFFYNKEYEKDTEGPLHTLISLIKGCVEPKVTKNKIYVVYQSRDGFEKTGFDIKKINVNLEENYNDGFPEISKEIIEGLNDKNKTNLVILRGVPGTGKTTYIRYLSSKIRKNIIFIAPDMVNHITDPSFIPFLIKNNDAVLIIEDAEPALGKRGISGRTGAVSNVLNLTDGLLSDCLNISIVATINTNEKDIDEALLRKGRLLKNYNFEKLSVEKSQVLLNKLKANVEVKEPMTLAEIYFHGQDNNAEADKPRKMGF